MEDKWHNFPSTVVFHFPEDTQQTPIRSRAASEASYNKEINHSTRNHLLQITPQHSHQGNKGDLPQHNYNTCNPANVLCILVNLQYTFPCANNLKPSEAAEVFSDQPLCLDLLPAISPRYQLPPCLPANPHTCSHRQAGKNLLQESHHFT